MRTKYDFLISVLSWEERFIKGFELNIKNYIKDVILLNHEEMKTEKEENLNFVINESQHRNLRLEIKDLPFEPIDRWFTLKNYFSDPDTFSSKRILIDITTMRRETIWALLSFLRLNNNNVDYVYSKPVEYNNKWLSREPYTPRLLLKHSGIAAFGYETALIILTGFDADRTRQLVNYYEPELTILGTQIGEQFQNDERNNPEYHIKEIKGLTKIETFLFDSYSVEEGYKSIKSVLQRLLEGYNIVISSQGPKLSAISVYKNYIEFPQIALSYVPCRQYNTNYSKGLSGQIIGHINF